MPDSREQFAGFRTQALVLIGLVIVVIYLTGDPGSLVSIVTVAGDAIAAHIGMLGWWAWLRRRGLVGTVRCTRPPKPAPEDPVRPEVHLADSTPP